MQRTEWRAIFHIAEEQLTNTKITYYETSLLSLGAISLALNSAHFKKSFVVLAFPGHCDCISK